MLAIKWPFIGFCLGVLLASIWPSVLLLMTPLYLILGCFLGRARCIFAFAVCVGVIWVNIHWAQSNIQARPLASGKAQHLVQGAVGFVSRRSHKIEFDFIPSNSFTSSMQSQRLKVSCYHCPFNVNEGEDWQFELRIKPIHSFQNPGGFDYRTWMLAKGYSAQAYVYAKSKNNRILDSSQLGFLNQLNTLLSAQSFPVLRALVLGDKNALDSKDKRLISSSGISHLFVVSGLHVGIVAGIAGLLLYWLQRPLLLLNWPYARAIAAATGIIFAVVYGAVTGFQVPAVRSVLMLVCAVIMMTQTRYTHVLHYFLFALVMVMLIKPLAFMDMGSWLSFSIVLALILGFAGGARVSWLHGLLKAQWLAFGMGGMVLLGFNQSLVPFSLCLNLFLIPLFTLLVIPAVLIAVVGALLGSMSRLIWLETALESLLWGLHHLSPIMTWWLPVFDEHRYLLMIGLGLCLLPLLLGLRILALVLVVTVLLLPVKTPEHGGFKLTVFDVGQGSAALIQTQNKYVLVDTGTRFMSGMGLADFVITPYLRQQRITQLDMLHLTHDDNDHAGGLNVLAKQAKVIVDQTQCETASWEYDGVLFDRFQAEGFQDGNNGSCLLKVTSAAGQSVLFSGDIEKEAESQLVKQNQIHLAADILIAPHHGSRSSSTDAFLNAVDSHAVIISAGFLNHYGHPHEQILAKYEDRNMMVYTTAYDGAIQVAFPPRQEALVVSTYRPNLGFTEQYK